MAPQSAQALSFDDDMPHDDAQENTNSQFITFSCADKNYGIDIMSVREIRSWSPVTQVPDQPPCVCGVLDIRGQVVQVVDLSLLLDGTKNEVGSNHVVIIVSVGGKSIGILVDAVSDIISVGKKDMRSVPSSERAGKRVVSGLAKYKDDLFSVLNLTSLLGEL